MLVKPKKLNLDYENSNPTNDYLTYLNKKLYSKNYLNVNYKHQNNINNRIHDNFYNNIYPLHYSQDKNTFPNNRNNYTLNTSIEKYNSNTNTNNNKKQFSFWDKNLSNLTINKYKRMREDNNFQTIQNETNSYRNDYLIHNTNSFRDYIDKDKINNEINEIYLNKNNDNENENDIINNIDNGESTYIDYNKKNKIRHLKNKIRLQKEISK